MKTTNKFKVILSTKHVIPIDKDEIEKVLAGIEGGMVVSLRQGMFNPSYFVGIEPDYEGEKKYWEDNKHQIKEGKMPRLSPAYEDIFKNQIKALK